MIRRSFHNPAKKVIPSNSKFATRQVKANCKIEKRGSFYMFQIEKKEILQLPHRYKN